MTHEVDPFDNTEVAGILGTSLPPVEPPAHLRAQILEAITRTPQAHEQAQEPAQPAAQTIAQVDEAMLRAEQFAAHIPEPTITAESASHLANAHVHTLPGRPAPSRSAAETSSRPPHEGDAQVLALQRPSTPRRIMGGLLRVAAAFALVAVGVGVGRWSAMDSMDSTMSYAKLNQMQDVARIEHTMADGHVATLTWSADMEMTALTLPSQMEAPAGKTLQVWKRMNGVVTPAGTYAPDRGAVFSFIDVMPEPGLEVFITLEPAGGSTQPTSKPLVVLRVSEHAMPDTAPDINPVGKDEGGVRRTSGVRPADGVRAVDAVELKDTVEPDGTVEPKDTVEPDGTAKPGKPAAPIVTV